MYLNKIPVNMQAMIIIIIPAHLHINHIHTPTYSNTHTLSLTPFHPPATHYTLITHALTLTQTYSHHPCLILTHIHPHTQIPFGIGQIGKAFRNEITPRNFIFRWIVWLLLFVVVFIVNLLFFSFSVFIAFITYFSLYFSCTLHSLSFSTTSALVYLLFTLHMHTNYIPMVVHILL